MTGPDDVLADAEDLELDLDDLPTPWASLPRREEITDLDAWAAAAAVPFAEERGLFGAGAVARATDLLRGFVDRPTVFDESWRLLFMPDPDWGGVVWEIVLGRPDGEWEQTARSLVGAGTSDGAGSHVSEFDAGGAAGYQTVAVDSVATPGGGEAVQATATLALRRTVDAVGTCDVVAHARTGDLTALSMSLEPLQLLLGSPDLNALVADEV